MNDITIGSAIRNRLGLRHRSTKKITEVGIRISYDSVSRMNPYQISIVDPRVKSDDGRTKYMYITCHPLDLTEAQKQELIDIYMQLRPRTIYSTQALSREETVSIIESSSFLTIKSANRIKITQPTVRYSVAKNNKKAIYVHDPSQPVKKRRNYILTVNSDVLIDEEALLNIYNEEKAKL